MQRIERFATAHPLWFVILATAGWILTGGLAAYLFSAALRLPLDDELPQSLGTLAATAAVLLVMWRLGWLRPAGITVLGSRRLWLAVGVLTLALMAVHGLAFFGKIGVVLSTADAIDRALGILQRNAVVGIVEETLFRGLLLYALVRAWGDTRRGLLGAIAVPALIFGVIHLMQLAYGNSLDDTLMTVLNATVSGFWYGMLVILGGSLWPAVLVHAATNAAVQIPGASLVGFDPSTTAFAVITAAELPLVLVGFWLLRRRADRQAGARTLTSLSNRPARRSLTTSRS